MPKHAEQLALLAASDAAKGAGENAMSMVLLPVQLWRTELTLKVNCRNWLFVEAIFLPQKSIFAMVSKPSNIKKVEVVRVELILNGRSALGGWNLERYSQ
jgi:hypothetical protein